MVWMDTLAVGIVLAWVEYWVLFCFFHDITNSSLHSTWLVTLWFGK